MKTTVVQWKQGMSFTGTAESGFEVPLGTDGELGGANDGFKPLELMSLSLGGCTAMDVISILLKKRQAVTAFEVRVGTEQVDEHPRVFKNALITYRVVGTNLQEAAVARAIELSATKYCPAQFMLGRVVPMELKYEIYEESASGERVLKVAGRVVLPATAESPKSGNQP